MNKDNLINTIKSVQFLRKIEISLRCCIKKSSIDKAVQNTLGWIIVYMYASGGSFF